MRLSHIKLAGFKSFVDPTHISLPGQLVGVVGPNGCGKSNVIDALRWVLGESRASALRGESMQDVIFNGSGNRKPVARASVELIFDNSLGKAAGQWASYAEIAIKRVLKRDGDSSYYINNQHVRRKDVTDIFLGTGLGARAYAIIEQGMISRIIEAKPEELRVFLEEAAGVSKYRDRRRETELRLSDTRENLLRVDDILHELDKQLVHLAEQAEVAKTYRALEQQRDTTQRLLWLVNKQEADTRRGRFAQAVEKTKTELEGEIARLRDIENQLEAARAGHYSLSDALHAKQGELYEVNASVARIEQQMTFLAEQRNRLSQQIAGGERQIDQQRVQLHSTQNLLTHWQQQQQDAARRITQATERATAQMHHLPQTEAAAQAAQARHNEVQRELMLTQQKLQLADTQRAHILRNQQQWEMRRARLTQEQNSLPPPNVAALELAQQQFSDAQTALADAQQQLADLQQQLPVLDADRRAKRLAAQEQERAVAQVEARLNALQSLQKQIDQDKNLQAWLAKYQLDKAQRVWHSIRIEAGWENALEAVLRERLNALPLLDLNAAGQWADAPPAKLAVYGAVSSSPDKGRLGGVSGLAFNTTKLTVKTETPSNSPNPPIPPLSGGSQSGGEQKPDSPLPATRHELPATPPLSQFVRCQDDLAAPVLADWLHGVYAVATLDQALERRAGLPQGAWMVTPQGHLVGANSVLFHAPDSAVHGVLARQREIENMQQQAQQQRVVQEAGKQQATQAEQAHQAVESRIAPLRATVSEVQQKQHSLQMQILKLTQVNERSVERGAQIDRELHELAEQGSGEARQQADIAQQMADLRERIAVQQRDAEQVKQAASSQEISLRQQREQAHKAQQEVQEANFYAKTCAEKIADLTRNVQHHTETLAQLEAALSDSQTELASMGGDALQAELQDALQQKSRREQGLAAARNALEHATMELSKLDQSRLVCEQKLHPLRDKVSELTLKEQEARLHFEQWAEQLQGVDEIALQALLEANPARPVSLQNELARLQNDIHALGAVNLAALEELQTAQERKAYLDAQALDLNQAMATLLDAIGRIDKESRDLLMATYDEVNRHLAEMFPVLFGGGEARLVLTGDEILDSGIQVMAQPPGKKNASIQLMSGGEKALTAIALVFSLFQLNPAPFCLLDEVDAPLDDTNTERLCKLIKKMALHTQFVFISHNKITMELAQQLIGVTMQERGVSKVVAVDIEEAMKMRDGAG